MNFSGYELAKKALSQHEAQQIEEYSLETA